MWQDLLESHPFMAPAVREGREWIFLFQSMTSTSVFRPVASLNFPCFSPWTELK
jgi:hypothetical protein